MLECCNVVMLKYCNSRGLSALARFGRLVALCPLLENSLNDQILNTVQQITGRNSV